MNTLEQSLIVEAGDFQVEVRFYPIEKRFGHEILLKHSGQQLVLKTDDRIEEVWPPCPPIQDIHFEDRGDCQLLFGVGMSGKTHYSVSIASDMKENLKFEFAANVKESPSFLGTTYLWTIAKENSGPGTDSQQTAHEIINNSLLADSNSVVSLTDGSVQNANRIMFDNNSGSLSIPSTIEWGFEIRAGHTAN